MGLKRATLFFECNKWGWSETYFSDGTDDGTVLADILKCLSSRTALLGTSASLTYIRVSEDGVLGDSAVYSVSPRTGAGRAVDGSSDIPNTSLVVRMQGFNSFKNRRTLYLRGQPDAEVTLGGDYNPTPDFIAAFNHFIGALITNNFGLRNSTFSPGVNISTAVQAANGNITVTTTAAHGLTYPGQANIVGLRGFSMLRGRHALVGTPTTTSFVFASKRLLNGTVTPGSGLVQQVTPVFSKLTGAQVISASHRNTGRPRNSPVGRRTVR